MMNKTLIISQMYYTNIEIIYNIIYKIFPTIKDQIDIHLINPFNSRILPKNINIHNYSTILFIPHEYTYKYFDKSQFDTYKGTLLNFNGWDQLTKLSLNKIWHNHNIPVPESIELYRNTNLSIPDDMFPSVIFSYYGHAGFGQHTLCNNTSDITNWLLTYPNKKDIMLQKFINFKHDNYFYKCRVIKIGNKIIPIYTHRSKVQHWHINPIKRDLNLYDIIDFNLNWFENKIGKKNFWNSIEKICEPLKIDNYAIDICVDQNNNVIPFEITVPYARNIVLIDNKSLFLQDFNCGINHQTSFFKWINISFDPELFSTTLYNYIIKFNNLKG